MFSKKGDILMGCDLHSVVQKKQPDGTWFDLSEGYEGRCYAAFGILAGVRGVGYDPISGSRGIPEGFSVVDDSYQPDNPDFKLNEYSDMDERGLYMGEHSFGHASFDEIIEREKDFRNEDAGHFVDWVYSILAEHNVDKDDLTSVKDFRLVFGFDS